MFINIPEHVSVSKATISTKRQKEQLTFRKECTWQKVKGEEKFLRQMS